MKVRVKTTVKVCLQIQVYEKCVSIDFFYIIYNLGDIEDLMDLMIGVEATFDPFPSAMHALFFMVANSPRPMVR